MSRRHEVERIVGKLGGDVRLRHRVLSALLARSEAKERAWLVRKICGNAPALLLSHALGGLWCQDWCNATECGPCWSIARLRPIADDLLARISPTGPWWDAKARRVRWEGIEDRWRREDRDETVAVELTAGELSRLDRIAARLTEGDRCAALRLGLRRLQAAEGAAELAELADYGNRRRIELGIGIEETEERVRRVLRGETKPRGESGGGNRAVEE